MDESGQTRYMYIISKGPFIILIIIKIYYIQLYIKYYSTIYSSDAMAREMCKIRMPQKYREYTLRKNVQSIRKHFLELGFSYLYKFTYSSTWIQASMTKLGGKLSLIFSLISAVRIYIKIRRLVTNFTLWNSQKYPAKRIFTASYFQHRSLNNKQPFVRSRG